MEIHSVSFNSLVSGVNQKIVSTLNVIVDESNSKNQSRRKENNREVVPSCVSDFLASGRKSCSAFYYYF